MEATASKNQGKFTQNIRNRELEICKICGEPTQYLVNIPLMNKRFLAHINCRCERKKLEIQRENELKQEKLSKIAELKNRRAQKSFTYQQKIRKCWFRKHSNWA